MLTAIIFNLGVPDRNGIVYNRESLEDAVAEFNASGGGFVTLDTIGSRSNTRVDLDRVAASATLTMDDNKVIAHVKLLPSTMGNVAKEILLCNQSLLGIAPVITGESVDGNVKVYCIPKLIFLHKDEMPRPPSDLVLVKAWLDNKININDLYKLKENDK